jgi:hypothetical protein
LFSGIGRVVFGPARGGISELELSSFLTLTFVFFFFFYVTAGPEEAHRNDVSSELDVLAGGESLTLTLTTINHQPSTNNQSTTNIKTMPIFKCL